MKKTAIILTGLCAFIQNTQLRAWSFFNSSSSEESSSTAAVDSSKGGTVTFGDKTYAVEPGKTFQVTGGGVHAQVNTVQESGQEPITTMTVEESEPQITINGEPAEPMDIDEWDSDEWDTDEEEDNEDESEESEINEDLDEDDSYEE